jgi:hypothetical protein
MPRHVILTRLVYSGRGWGRLPGNMEGLLSVAQGGISSLFIEESNEIVRGVYP